MKKLMSTRFKIKYSSIVQDDNRNELIIINSEYKQMYEKKCYISSSVLTEV